MVAYLQDDERYSASGGGRGGPRLSGGQKRRLAALLAGFPDSGLTDAVKAAGAVNAVPFNAFTGSGDDGLTVNGIPGAGGAGGGPEAAFHRSMPVRPVPPMQAGRSNVGTAAPSTAEHANHAGFGVAPASAQWIDPDYMGPKPPPSPWGELPRGYYVDPDWLREEAIKQIKIKAAPYVKDTVKCNREYAGLIFYNFKTNDVTMSRGHPGPPCGTVEKYVCSSEPNLAINEKHPTDEVVIANWHTHPKSDTRYHSHQRLKSGGDRGDIPGIDDLMDGQESQFIGGFVIDWEGHIYFYSGKNKDTYQESVGTVIGLPDDLGENGTGGKKCD